MENIIYCLLIFSVKRNKFTRKVGSTQNIVSRMKHYITGNPDPVPLECYYKIDCNCYKVDNNIKQEYDSCRLNKTGDSGGIEFYDSSVLTHEELENYFHRKNIRFTKHYIDCLNNEWKKPIDDMDDDNIQNDRINKNKVIQSTENMKKPRGWQIDLVNNFNEFLLSSNKAGIVIAPTGCGKSFMMLYLSIFIYIQTNDVVIMTKRKEILDKDFIDEGEQMIKQLGKKIKIVNMIKVGDDINNYKLFNINDEYNRIFIINTDKFIASSHFNNYKNYSFGKAKLFILDECHWAGASKLNDFLLYIKNNVCEKLLGLSATPVRQADENKINSLKLFEANGNYNIIYIRSYIKAIEDGDRTKTKWIIIPIKKSDLEKNNEDNKNDDEMYRIDKVLNKKGFDTFLKWFNHFISRSINKKGILWFPNKKNLKDFYKIVKESSYLNNITFFPTYSKSDKDEDDTSANLEAFKKIDNNAIALAVFRATEGFNDIRVDFGFNLYTTKSVNALLDQQKEGRVSRNFQDKEWGYYGFISIIDDMEYTDLLVKRLGNWIEYIKEFETKHIKGSKSNKPSISTTHDYIDMLLDDINIKEIDYNMIRKEIFKYCEKINSSMSSLQIHRLLIKENKARLTRGIELIDSKHKFTLYARENDIPIDIPIKNNNWIEFLHPEFNELKQKYKPSDELIDFILSYNIDSIDMFKKLLDTNIFPSYEYIDGGFYNNTMVGFNITKYFITNEEYI